MNYCKDKQLKLRYLFLGGEALPGELYNKLTGVFDVDNIINIYGPTEITINATSYTCKGKEYGETVPIGKPLFNYRVYILDQELNPVFPGGTGELFISGTGVSRGYLNRPELTNQKFLEVQKPFPKKVSGPRRERLYRSGDLCRWLANGNIEFLRRMDQQIKIRGFRVELGEIENCLLHYPGIKEAVVLAREEAAGDKYLCAYIVADKGCDETDVRNFLTKKLPNYMIPLFFVQLDKIPLTVNGKIDRIALPRTALKDNISYIAPRDEIEKKLVELWLDILYGEVLLPSQIQRTIGISDNFFELGGHSLKATILVFRIEKIFNVKIPLSEIFKNPRIKEIAGYIKDAVNWKYEQVELVEKKEYYSLSSAQERLYFLQQMDKDGTVYNLPSIMGVEGIVHKDKLEQSILGLIRRHESLRTSIEIIKEEPVQRIHEQVEFKIEYFNFSTGSTDNLNEKIHPSFIIHHFIRAFDFSKVPLLRVGLAALAEDKHLFMVDMHHIISDGISTQVLVKDFSALYTGNQLPEINLQYKDYAEWQNRGRTDKKIQEQGDYWKKEYEGEIPLLVLPVDFERPVVQGFEGNSINFEINKETSSTLKNLALKAGATLYIMLLALYTILLSKLSSQEDIVIGSPVAGRRHADLEKIIGMFVNTLALRNYPSGEKRFHDFLEEVKEKTLKAFENQEYQYEDLVEKIAVKRDAGRNPLFDSMFSLQNIDSQEIDIPGLKLVPYATESKISKFDLSLTVLEVQDKLLFTFEYSTKLFSETTIERFIAYFLNIINGVIENNRKRISEYEIITEVEKNRILFEFNNTGVVYPKDKTIHQLFAEQAEKFPDRIGIVGADEGEEKKRRREEKKDGGVETLRATSLHITYLQLNEQSDHLAGLLIEKGVKPNTIVGIMMERSVEMIVGILGILKSGGAYLPIDPGYPQERIDYMLKDSNAEILLTNKSEARISKHETNSNDQNTNVQNKNFENLAYIIYTSGSTGKPKGVLIAHSSAVNLFYAMQNEYPLEKSDTFLLKTSYVFDVSVIELFGWYMGGSRLAVLEKDGHKDPRVIVDSIEKHNVSHINFVPSMFSAFIEYLAGGKKHRTASLKYIFLAGEALLPTLIEKFRNLNTGIRLENIYGPTESTVYCSKYSLSGWNGISSIPIGKPLPNIKVYILNKYGFVQPVGVSGELFISGDGVSRGYLNNPELTAEKFVIRHSSLVNGDKRIVNSHRSLVSGKNQKIESPSNLPNDQCPMTNDRFYKTGDWPGGYPMAPLRGGTLGGLSNSWVASITRLKSGVFELNWVR
ncbi:MAG: amino acid adenylation domain-containing protein [Acidobacteria bacterium]|nr:amino acid adenylation domain-containing protein [Acidobacteriota bacterium]